MAANITANDRSPYQRSTASTPPLTGSRRGTDLRTIQGETPRQDPKPRVRPMSWQAVAYVGNFSGPGLLGAVSPTPEMKFPTSSEPPVSGNVFPHPYATIGTSPYVVVAGARKGWLPDALDELDQIDHEAAEEGWPRGNNLSKGNAKRIITELSRGTYPQPAIYPTEDGEIAILFQIQSAQAGVLILIDAAGGGACFSTIAGKRRRARYDDASDLPDAFVKGELLKLNLA